MVFTFPGNYGIGEGNTIMEIAILKHIKIIIYEV
jgi:hypothetical protein